MDAGLQDLTAHVQDAHWWFVARRSILTTVVERILPDGGDVLDIGCGTGYLLAHVPAAYGRIGIDPSTRAIELGRTQFPDVDLRVGRAPDDIVRELGQTDLVLLCDVLEHLEYPRLLLDSVVGHLGATKHVLITVPAGRELWSPHDVAHGHFRRYEREDIAALVDGLPARVVLVSPFNWRLYPLIRLARLVTRLSGTTVGHSDTDLALPPPPLNWLLRRVFSGESKTILATLDGSRAPPNVRGVSWMILLETGGPESGDAG